MSCGIHVFQFLSGLLDILWLLCLCWRIPIPSSDSLLEIWMGGDLSHSPIAWPCISQSFSYQNREDFSGSG